MYDHYFDHEICENLKQLIEKDSKLGEPKVKESEDIIAKLVEKSETRPKYALFEARFACLCHLQK